MRRDMDLVRVILLKIEEEHAGVGLANLEVEGYDRDIIAYHCQLLEEAAWSHLVLCAMRMTPSSSSVLAGSHGRGPTTSTR